MIILVTAFFKILSIATLLLLPMLYFSLVLIKILCVATSLKFPIFAMFSQYFLCVLLFQKQYSVAIFRKRIGSSLLTDQFLIFLTDFLHVILKIGVASYGLDLLDSFMDISNQPFIDWLFNDQLNLTDKLNDDLNEGTSSEEKNSEEKERETVYYLIFCSTFLVGAILVGASILMGVDFNGGGLK